MIDRLLAAYARVIVAIGALERAFGVFLIALITVTIAIQVFTRYVLNYPIVWVEELATYAFIWSAFVGAALALKSDRHIRIATFGSRLGPRQAIGLRLVGLLLVLLLVLMLADTAMVVMGVEGRSRSIALPIDIPRKWFYSVPLFVCMASMTLTLVHRILADLRALFAPAGAS